MNIYLFYNILFISIAYSSQTNKLSQIEKISNKVSSTPTSQQDNKFLEMRMVSEGGPLLKTAPSTLPKEAADLTYLDKEIVTTKQKPVARRNGVGNPLPVNIHSDEFIKSNNVKDNHPTINNTETAAKNKSDSDKSSSKPVSIINTDNKNDILQEITEKQKNVSKNLLPIIIKENNASNIIALLNNVSKEKNISNIHKKPLILSADALADMGENQADKSIVKTMKQDHIKLNKESSHPEMIMPIVITILIVPMFAVLGYMAIKRGQEAWKNRHYKRMDFLLDGMYND